MDRMLRPVHRWIWRDLERRVRKLLCFAEVEADGGRDILRAAEVTPDPLLRRLYLAHAIDELHHADLFRQRGTALLHARFPRSTPKSQASWLGSGDHGLDDLRIEEEPDDSLLAFLHLSEKAAAGRFAIYRDVVQDDPSTRAVFEEILRDEVFHMNYTYTQLARVLPQSSPPAALAGTSEPPVETVPARGGRAGRSHRHLDSHDPVFHPATALRLVRQARRETGAARLDSDPTRPQRIGHEPVLR